MSIWSPQQAKQNGLVEVKEKPNFKTYNCVVHTQFSKSECFDAAHHEQRGTILGLRL